MRILLSGAHLTPALAMIDFIQTNHPGEHELLFVGRLFSQDTLGQKAVEKMEVTKRKVTFIPFTAPKFTNHSLINKAYSILRFPKVVAQARRILQRQKIDLFLSFGSYLAVPFAIAAKSLGIKVVTHEQTVMIGKANQFIASIADGVAISHQASKQYFKRSDVVLTGNPVRARLFAKDLKRPAWLSETAHNIILVMGGNQGSFVINDAMQAILPKILPDYTVIHQCGRANKLRDSLTQLMTYRQTLPPPLQQHYFLQEWITDEDLFWIYQHALFAISRSGANAVLELSLAPLPAILIPLPGTYQDEQAANAKLMQQQNGALIVPQQYLTPETLVDAIGHMRDNHRQMRRSLARQANTTDACARLYQLLMHIGRQT